MSLKTLLEKEAKSWTKAGGSAVNAISALKRYKSSVMRRLFLQLAVSAILLATALYATTSYFSEQGAIASIFAAIIGIVSMLVMNLHGTWREIDYTNMLLWLIRDADDALIQTIIKKILDKL